MNIVYAMVLSIIIKAISALVEIAIQMTITNRIGVGEYGNYSFFVSLIEGAYFFLFSGSIKLNTFYLSTSSFSLKSFKKKYNRIFVVPIILVISIVCLLFKFYLGVISAIILLVFYFAYDASSVFFSRGRQLNALLGEYLLGRLVLFIGVVFVVRLNNVSILILLCLYGLQFLIMVLWFSLLKRKIVAGVDEVKVPIRKLFEYQVSDVATSLITYSPTILQFILGGAFTAGFTSIISLVKKFINFISGPTAKVFLPEFSRLYKSGDKKGLENSYLMIVRIQMVFIGSIGAVLIGFPNLILHMFSPELEQYSNIFTGTAIALLIVSGIGPVTGMLQMTGNENVCNRNQWISIGVMIAVSAFLFNKPLFAVYGLCAQAIVEGLLKYFSVCKWFGKNIIPIKNYVLLWLPVFFVRAIVDYLSINYSFVVMLLCTILVFCWNSLFAIKDSMVKDSLAKFIKRR